MFYTFQKSKIWEAGDPLDRNSEKARIKAKTEFKARKLLGNPGFGRVWLLIKTEGPEGVEWGEAAKQDCRLLMLFESAPDYPPGWHLQHCIIDH